MAAAAMSSPAPATRSPAVMVRPTLPRGPGALRLRPPSTAAAPTRWLVRSVSIAASAGGARGRRLPRRGDFVPHAAVDVDAVALGLARCGVRGVGIQRVPVVGDLLGAVGPGDRAERAGDALPGGRGPGHRRPDLRAGPGAFRRGGRVR